MRQCRRVLSTISNTDPTRKPRLLQVVPSAPALEEALAARFRVTRLLGRPEDDATLADAASEVEAVFTIGSIGLGRTRIAALPNLRIVSCLGVGYEGVDVAACLERGVMVTHSPGANARSVAELALALLLDATRQVSRRDRAIRQRGGSGATFRERGTPVPSLYGRTLGILGFGDIGQLLAERAAALEMEVAYHSRTRRPERPERWCDTPLALARSCDALIVCVPGGPATRHMVDAAVLEALGPDGVLVNVSRGSVVDQAALIKVLSEGRIHGAGLDVYDGEPDIPDALLMLDNVVLSPHCAGLTHQAQDAMANRTLANLDAFLAGAPVPDPIPELARLQAGRR